MAQQLTPAVQTKNGQICQQEAAHLRATAQKILAQIVEYTSGTQVGATATAFAATGHELAAELEKLAVRVDHLGSTFVDNANRHSASQAEQAAAMKSVLGQ